MVIDYKKSNDLHKVMLVGHILCIDKLFTYRPQGSKVTGERFDSLKQCQRSLEEL